MGGSCLRLYNGYELKLWSVHWCLMSVCGIVHCSLIIGCPQLCLSVNREPFSLVNFIGMKRCIN